MRVSEPPVPYKSMYGIALWETSSLRKWLSIYCAERLHQLSATHPMLVPRAAVAKSGTDNVKEHVGAAPNYTLRVIRGVRIAPTAPLNGRRWSSWPSCISHHVYIIS